MVKNEINAKPYYFDRGRVYYPLVMNYIHSVHGFNDLASRGLINKLAELKISKSENEINGNKLFKENKHDGFLNFGDPIALLWDIEQNHL